MSSPVADEGVARPGVVFSTVGRPRISEVIVEQVREQIRAGTLPLGSRLPSERELVEQFGASRLVVREALRVLESSGLVVVRKGRRGGTFVSAPTSSQVERGITDMLSASTLSAADVMEARAVLEISFVALVADRVGPEELRALHELCDEHEQARVDGSYTVEMSFDFHRRLIACAHNEAATMLLNGVREPILAGLREADHAGTAGVAEHRAVLAAIERQDASGAQLLMSEHLRRTTRRLH